MKTYNSLLISIACLCVGLCAGIVLWAQPLNGDLTRIGGYPERLFGWNSNQQKVPSLHRTERQPGKKHVLVIGDSFSEAGFWQAYLSQDYTFDFQHSKHARLDRLIERIQREKPDAIVIETAERALPELYATDTHFLTPITHCAEPAPVHSSPTPAGTLQAAIAALPVFPANNRKTFPDAGYKISEGFHFLKLAAKNTLRPQKRKANVLPLTTNNLFSHQASSQLLVLARDSLLREPATVDVITTTRCSMQDTARTLSAAGVAFAIVAIPDKTSAYQPYLADETLRAKPLLIEQLQVDALPHGINLLPDIRQLLAAGVHDVYLPNDTHWGNAGFQLAAVRIRAELEAQWPK